MLSVIHQEDTAAGVFADAVAEAGHELVEWNAAEASGPPLEPEAALVFGGAMHVDQEERHGWLRDEDALLRRWLSEGVPLLGVCLGGQLLAKALDAPVRRMASPEIGWFDIALTPEAANDPVFAALPERFDAFQWHSYAFELPRGAVPLARNPRSLQAYRAGEAAWGLQFHAEVTKAALDDWLESSQPEDGAIDAARLRAASAERIERSSEIGKEICTRFLAVAQATARDATTRATSPDS